MNTFIGKQIGPYQIESAVGSGNSGDVYRAQNLQSGRTTAVKIFYPHLAENPQFRQKVLQEALGLSRLKHNNIAIIYEISEANEILLQATEWVNGESLGQIMPHQQGMSLALAANLIEQAADGLAYAHRQGVVHGGLHPNNLLLRQTGGDYPWRVYLTDFRLTSLLNGEAPRRLLPYLAPEWLKGRRDDGRSDIYALGIILYEAVTRRLPHQPQTSAEAMAIGRSAAPKALRSDIPDSLDKIILKAIAPKVTDRYRSMEEFLHVIRQEAEELPNKATEVATPPPMMVPPIPAASPLNPAPTPQANVSPGDEVIVINHPQENTRHFGLKKWLITIGQMAGNDLMLTGEGVAAKHARLERSESGWMVVDMGSRFGTFLENSRLLPDVPEIWREGQILRIGPYTLAWGDELVTAVPEPEPVAAPPPVEEPPSPPGLHLKLSPALVDTAPGNSAGILLELENQTDALVELKLRVEGIPSDWLAVENPPIRLVAGQHIKVPAMLHPPRHSSATAGVHRYQIFAEPTYGSTETAVASGQLSISPFSQYFAELEPLPLTHAQPAKIIVHNEGNIPDRYTLVALDADQELEFDLPQNSLDIQPGQSESVPITAAGQKRPFLVKQNIIPMELHVQNNTGKRVEKGRVVIPPVISLLLLLVMLLPILCLALFGARWYLCQDNIEFIQAPFNRVCSAGTAAVAEIETPTPTPTETAVDVVAAETPEVPSEATPTEPPPTDIPGITAEYIEIGRSTEDLPIMAARLGEGANSVLFVGGIHAGYAPASVSLAEDFIAYLEGNPQTIPAGMTIYVVPKLNPDSENVPGDGRYNANGVDLNRNWQCNWAAIDGRGGTEPLSEAESQALSNFIDSINPEAIVFWNAPLQASNQRSVSPGKCQVEQDTSEKLAKLYADKVSYEAKQANLGGSVTGDITDSLADKGIAAIFVLLHSQTDANVNEHLPAIVGVLNTFAP